MRYMALSVSSLSQKWPFSQGYVLNVNINNILSCFLSLSLVTEYSLTSQALNIDALKFPSKKITGVFSDCGFWLFRFKLSFKLRV